MLDSKGAFRKIMELPALQEWENTISELDYEIGIWGKYSGSGRDYGWIARSSHFLMTDEDYDKRFYLGSLEDVGEQPVYMWQQAGSMVFAGSLSLSHRNDRSNRPSLQATVLASAVSTRKIPAPIQLLLLLPKAQVMQKERQLLDELVGMNLSTRTHAEQMLTISSNKHPAIPLCSDVLCKAFQSGLDYIKAYCSTEQLTAFYAQLLEGGRPAVLSEQVCPPEVAGVLLTFLSRSQANSFSILERTIGGRVLQEHMTKNWDAILFSRMSDSQVSYSDISPNVWHEAEKIADSIMQFDLSIGQLSLPASQASLPAPLSTSDSDDGLNITVWGPASAGKTVFLAQLYLEGTRYKPDWEIRVLSEASQKFTDDIRQTIRRDSLFPIATTAGHSDTINFALINQKQGLYARLTTQDQAGRHFTDLKPEMVSQLKQSSGLILLFDPTLEQTDLEDDVWNTLQTLEREAGENGKIVHPIAVCLSKADYYINNQDDLHFAETDPDMFIRHTLNERLIELVDNFCQHYSFFPISAVGINVGNGHVEKIVFYDDSLISRITPDNNTRSFNLFAPIEWLLNAAHG